MPKKIKLKNSIFLKAFIVFLILSICTCVYANIFSDAQNKLSEGRFYRRLFRLEDFIEDIRMKYRPSPQEFTEYYKLIEALTKFESLYKDPEWRNEAILGLAETVNEILQAQSLVANHYMIESFRIRYPYSDNPVVTELPKATGTVRDEVKKVAAAKDEYNLGLLAAMNILNKYKEIFRSRAESPIPYEGLPQFLQFSDENIQNGYPQPLLNEFWQLSNALYNRSLASYSIAHRLFGLSHNDDLAKEEAVQEFKQCAHDTFLASAILAAAQTPEDFQLNQGQRLKIQVVNSREMHKYIIAGLTPLGDDGKLIPNGSFESFLSKARDSINDLKYAEAEAHSDTMEYNNVQEKMIQEIIDEREGYLAPMRTKYGVDPAGYGNLHTDEDQAAYKEKVKNLIEEIFDNPTNEVAAKAGELGLCVLKVIDNQINVERDTNNVARTDALIQKIEYESGEIVKAYEDGRDEITALDLSMGNARAWSFAPSISVSKSGVGFSSSVTTQFMPDRQQSKIADIQSDMDYQYYSEKIDVQESNTGVEVKRLLLEQLRYTDNLRQAQNLLTMANTELDLMVNEMEHTMQRLNLLRADLQDIWYKDPSFAVEASYTKREVENKLGTAIRNCYRAARVLEYEWVEEYSNPVNIPLQPPYYIEGNDYDYFTDTFSIFSAQRSYDCEDFLDALMYWDAKLREPEVRGPNNPVGPAGGYGRPQWISLRDDILGFKELYAGNKIELFRKYIKENIFTIKIGGREYNVLRVNFATIIEDCSLFPGCSGAYVEHWNQRIKGVAADINAEADFSSEGLDCLWVYLVQSGTVTMRRFWNLVEDEDFFWNYSIERSYDISGITDEKILEDFLKMRISQSVFRSDFLATINKGASFSWYMANENSSYLSKTLDGRSISASDWMFIIDTSDPMNRGIDFNKINDIKFLFFYTYGNPRDFMW